MRTDVVRKRIRRWGYAVSGLAGGVGGSLLAGVVSADPITVTTYTDFVADVTGAITTSIPAMLTAVAPVAAGLIIVAVGIGLVRQFAR